MPDEPDGGLLRRFVQGDRDAFESLFRLFEVEVYRWVLRIVRDASMAEDVVVEAFCRAWVDVSLAAFVTIVLLIFPRWLLLLAYHL